MTNNPLLGKLLSEHNRAIPGRGNLSACGCLLSLPFIFGLWGMIATLTYARDKDGADDAFYIASAIVAGCLGLFGLWALLIHLSPAWLKRYKLEIYENGFIKQDLFKTRTCLWHEIRDVNPMLLVYDKASRNMPPSEFGNSGEDTRERGIYEVYKQDGRKIIISRRYTDVERLDERLIPFCHEPPQWEESAFE